MLREAERDSYVRNDAALVRELEYLCTHLISYLLQLLRFILFLAVESHDVPSPKQSRGLLKVKIHSVKRKMGHCQIIVRPSRLCPRTFPFDGPSVPIIFKFLDITLNPS